MQKGFSLILLLKLAGIKNGKVISEEKCGNLFVFEYKDNQDELGTEAVLFSMGQQPAATQRERV